MQEREWLKIKNPKQNISQERIASELLAGFTKRIYPIKCFIATKIKLGKAHTYFNRPIFN